MNPIVKNILKELDKITYLSPDDAVYIIDKVIKKSPVPAMKVKNETEPT